MPRSEFHLQWAAAGYLLGFIILMLGISGYVLATVRIVTNIGSSRASHELEAAGPNDSQTSEQLASPTEVDLEAGEGLTPADPTSPASAVTTPSPSITTPMPLPPKQSSFAAFAFKSLRPGSTGAPTPGGVTRKAFYGAAASVRSVAAASHASAAHSRAKLAAGASVVAFEPMTVTFTDLKYTVKLAAAAGGGQKMLLQGVSGYALPGTLTALMGASGAGKTTLLDVIAGRKNQGKIEGEIKLNGFATDVNTFSRVTAYVEQADIHSAFSTVKEAVEFSAHLRLPASVSDEQRHEFVDEILSLLELNDIAHRKIGDPGAADGLSPGQRKRLTIAVELASSAPVIFLEYVTCV